jgi:DNA-directed RNA polymerase subunit RPC12/RpoP
VRLPIRDIHRAFPELDIFSDEECRRYLLQVRAQHRIITPSLAGALAAFALWWIIVAPLTIRQVLRITGSSENVPAAFVALIILAALAACMTFLFLRDFILIRGIRNRINNARCTNCRHSLLGLPLLAAADPSVRCPECGSLIILHHIGLNPDDLRPRETPDAPTAPP